MPVPIRAEAAARYDMAGAALRYDMAGAFLWRDICVPDQVARAYVCGGAATRVVMWRKSDSYPGSLVGPCIFVVRNSRIIGTSFFRSLVKCSPFGWT
ncbi:hypothetical protein GCM10029978_111670 [Actinoallomurus acanthiterrae]